MEFLWRNVFGEDVKISEIDSRYAVNILIHRSRWLGALGVTEREIREDPMTEALVEAALSGREPTEADKKRMRNYNARAEAEGLSLRA